MKMETAKSLVLIVLIGISLLLTFGLWSYQPDLALNEEPSNEAVDIGGRDNETKKSVIEPREIVFHMDDRHYGFSDPNETEGLFEQMQEWSITNFQTNLVSGRTPNQYEVEIIFPTELPMEILNILLTISDSTIVLPNWSFDRMYVTFDSETKSLNVEILSIDGRNEATAVINDASYYELLWKYFQSDDEELLQEYIALEQTREPIYIPKDARNLRKQSFTYELIDVPNQLIEVLFRDPSLVSQSYSSETGDTYYTDSKSGMHVYADSGRMKYVNPYSEDSVQDDQTTKDILTNSITHINSHSGWTDEYNLMDINGKENSVRYQMYREGYPIYNALNLSYIDQKWINLQLNEYSRPLFRLNNPLGGSAADLMSGQNLVAYLTDNPNYNLENIQDIRLGYRLIYHYNENSISENNVNDMVIELVPAWFKQENGQWNEISFTEEQLLKGGN
ncbi:hypothetical protein CV093_21335 [Oceanobacillus sp. 143]|uniref:Regulatory protein YycH domain-containing protein n=1 Tax=Oceanobacillus zhaokaii TaxID=2052660 RepID=A0A345PLZ4_9BACI|nr:two-component system activity regulator YycH [Oceanobacillus zhaokaii]AXI11024.1 hypothetical protein CUC15_19775 [Oceanobacillus zhaokaii]QGS69828.1 hypothetical protein CV093_21335 [Oceanobacillus sp. 143]